MDPDALNEMDPEALPQEVVVTDVLDLHGFFPEQVDEIMKAFLDNALERGLTHLRVVHGKGKSRMKYEVHRFLRQHDRVADFGDAPPHLGGWGATLIEIKGIG